jgi:hypothetical protein
MRRTNKYLLLLDKLGVGGDHGGAGRRWACQGRLPQAFSARYVRPLFFLRSWEWLLVHPALLLLQQLLLLLYLLLLLFMLLYLLLLLLLDDELLLEEALPERFLGSYWGRGMAGWLEWNPSPDPDHLT